jgi:3-methylcrotonyl-CoA carboxylase alpha subunit
MVAPVRYEAQVASRAFRIDVDASGRALVDGEAVPATIDEVVRARQWRVGLAGRTHEITLLTREPMRLLVDGVEVEASAHDERSPAASRGTRQHASGRHELRAPMPGILRAVHVREGDVVEREAPIVTLEAMKMENELRAPARARIVRLDARAGEKVEGGAILAVLAEIE